MVDSIVKRIGNTSARSKSVGVCLFAIVLVGCQPYPRQKPMTSMDDAHAVELYRHASQEGDLESIVNLGFMYERGRGVPQDEEEAARLYKLAADQGSILGQVNLAVMYVGGRGVPQNDVEAIQLLKSASLQGSDKAKLHLAELYQAGRGGLGPDDPEALAALSSHIETAPEWQASRFVWRYREGRVYDREDLERAVRIYEILANTFDNGKFRTRLQELYKMRQSWR